MASHAVFKAGNTALITGAASGIGLAVAKLCRSHGMKLALVDNNDQKLSQAKQSLSEGAETEIYPLDVSKIEEWKELRGKVEKKFGGVDFLMLNAGIGAKSSWEDTEYFHKVCQHTITACRYSIAHCILCRLGQRGYRCTPVATGADVSLKSQIMDTNLFGVINGISTFLPVVRSRSNETAIIITGSKQGITNPPGNPACTSANRRQMRIS